MRFLCDHMLGTLARWLRFLGYDTAYPEAMDDRDIRAAAADEGRTLLTRDRDLSARVPDAVFVESDQPDEQLLQVVRRFGLSDENALSRCSVCNARLAAATPDEVRERVPPGVLERNDSFWRCPGCPRVYWAGSHFDRMGAKIRDLMARAKTGA